MTAKTSDFSNLIYYNPAGPGFNPVASATVTGPASINEGATATFNVVTWGIPNGTTLYWQARNRFNINIGRFSAVGGTFTIIKNRGSFTITVDANHTTQTGQQTYGACISKVSTTSDDILAVFSGVVVNDTSLTPAKPTGLIRKTYNGYYYTGTEASQWFKDKTPIDTLIGAPLGDGDPGEVHTQHLSYEWVGYFSPPATDDYTFYVNSDDYTLVWIGSNAVSAYTNSNADIACPTSQSRQSSAISLTGGDFVPIRIQFGNDTGGGELHVSWSSTQHPTPSRNFDWLIYHDTEVVPTYELTTQDSVTSVDEGVPLTFNISTTGVADGTTLYWGHGDNFNAGQTGRFSQGNGGTVVINSNAGSFALTVSADNTTAIVDPQQYIVRLYSGNYGGFGGVEVASLEITVNDTSQTPTVTYPDPGGLNGGLHDRTWDATWDQTFAWFGSHSTSFDQISYGSGHGFGQPGNPYGPATARLEGYFAPTQAGSYTFTLASDNSAWVWVGNNVATASIANSNLSTGGITSITVSLVPGDFYPILVVYTQGSNGPEQAGFTLFASGTGITGSINSWPGDGYGWH
jgi:hypothetical protein